MWLEKDIARIKYDQKSLRDRYNAPVSSFRSNFTSVGGHMWVQSTSIYGSKHRSYVWNINVRYYVDPMLYFKYKYILFYQSCAVFSFPFREFPRQREINNLSKISFFSSVMLYNYIKQKEDTKCLHNMEWKGKDLKKQTINEKQWKWMGKR